MIPPNHAAVAGALMGVRDAARYLREGREYPALARVGDHRPLPATVTVEAGRVRVALR